MAEPTYMLEVRPDAEPTDRGSGRWACTCILCRLIAVPIFRRLAKEVEAEEERISEEKTPVEVAKEISTGASGAEVGPAEKEEKEKERDIEVIVSRIVEEFDKRVATKVNSIEKELEAVKNEFSTVVNDLRNAIIEVRSSISELANPFNYMRKYAEIVDEGGKLLQLLTQLQPQPRQQEAQQTPQALHQLAPIIAQLPASEELKMLLSSMSIGTPSPPQSQRPSHFARILRLIRWIDENIIGIPKEIIDELTSFAAESGLISEKEKSLLFSAIKFVEEMRKRGVGVREQLIMLYTIAKMLGVEDREADNELLKMIIEEGRKVHGGVQP